VPKFSVDVPELNLQIGLIVADADMVFVLKAMDGHILGKGVLVGRFHR